MLIDTGNSSDGYYITDFLKAQNISKSDYLILTHLDEDHIGGTNKIVQELEINIFWRIALIFFFMYFYRSNILIDISM